MYNLNKRYLIRRSVMEMVRMHEPVSRTDISIMTGQRMATIVETARELIEDGVIIESGDMEGPGIKKKKLLLLNGDTYRALGIDIRSDRISAALTDIRGDTVRRDERKIHPDIEAEDIIRILYDLIDISICDTAGKCLLGIGISNPGIIDKDKNRIIFSSQLKNWRDIPIRQLIETRYRLPLYIEDSALLNLLAEKRFGKAAASENAVFIQMGASFGAGFIANGCLVRGTSGMAGEIGHTMVEPGGKLCVCGNRGCLQTEASETAIVGRFLDLLQSGSYSTLMQKAAETNGRITYDDICDAAEKGDKICLGLLEDAGRHIGIALSNTINLLNPEMVIFGGDMARRGDIMIESIKRAINTNALHLSREGLSYGKASFLNDGGERGAAAAVLDAFFRDPPEHKNEMNGRTQ